LYAITGSKRRYRRKKSYIEVEMNELIANFRAKPAPWLIVLFICVLCWGIQARWQRQKRSNKDKK
jgi:hypothetical protein